MDLPNEDAYPDYYDTIKDPICLNQILAKVKNVEYSSAIAYSDDIELCFSNATSYNQRGTERIDSVVHSSLVTLHVHSLPL